MQLLPGRTYVAITALVVCEFVMCEVALLLADMFLMRYTGCDIVFLEVLVIRTVAVGLVRNGRIDLYAGIVLMLFYRLGKHFPIMNVCRSRNRRGHNSVLVVNNPMVLVSKRRLAVLPA